MIKIISGYMKWLRINNFKLWFFVLVFYTILAFFWPKFFLELKIYVAFLLLMAVWLIGIKKTS